MGEKRDGARLGYELMEVATALRRSVRRRLRAATASPELRPAQVELMLVVARHPGLSVAAAAREMNLADNSVSTLVNQLVRAGMLIRRTDPADRRAARLEVTPAARQRIEDYRERRARLVGARMEELTDADLAAIEAALPALRRLLALLREPPAGDADVPTASHVDEGGDDVQ